AAAHLFDAFGSGYPAAAELVRPAASASWWKMFDRMLLRPSIQTSSAGRLFDAVAALTGICVESSFEGEAAMLLEAAAGASASSGEAYPFTIQASAFPWTIDTRPIIQNIAQQCMTGHSRTAIARAFHRTLGHIMKTLSVKLRDATGLNAVCLS